MFARRSMLAIHVILQGHFSHCPLIGQVYGASGNVKDHATPFNDSLHYLGNIVWNAFKPLPYIIIYTSSFKGNGGSRRNQLCFSDGLDSDRPTRAASSLVVTHHPILWSTSSCCVWCLLSSHVNSTHCHPRRNHCCLSAGKFWVRIYVLNVKTCLLYSNERITVGYHRLFSHRSFNTSVGVRVIIALMGASATQGSIKVKHTSRFRI